MNQQRNQQKNRWCALVFAALAYSAICGESTTAVVFEEAPGAGDSQALYGYWGNDVSAANPPASSYSNYRKGGTNEALPTAADNGDMGDLQLGTWTHVTHFGQCCGDPGMFFGQSNSTSSYRNSVLHVKDVVEPGFGQEFDPNGRRRWDIRVGFAESEADYVEGKAANSGEFDLWTRDHGTDTVYLQLGIGSNAEDLPGDSPLGDETKTAEGQVSDVTNHYSYQSAFLYGQSGNEPIAADDVFRGEQDRNKWMAPDSMNVRHTESVMTDPTQTPTIVDQSKPELELEITGTGFATQIWDTGVGYDDAVPIEWWMEANDPGNPDAVEARKVAFNLQVGNMVMTQIFDPGGSDEGNADDMVPNPSFDPDNAFQNGYFDWQNAIPIMYIGVTGGTGENAEATATMGFEARDVGLPGDFNADGLVDGADFLLWQRDSGVGSLADWEANFGNVAAAAATAAVPEPVSAAILAIGAAGFLGLSRRRRARFA